MRALFRFSAVLAVLATCTVSIASAARSFTEFIFSPFIALAKSIRSAFVPAYAFADGSELEPGVSSYESPPGSSVQHERFVRLRSSARGG